MSAEVMHPPGQSNGQHFYHHEHGLPSTPPRHHSPTPSIFLDQTPRATSSCSSSISHKHPADRPQWPSNHSTSTAQSLTSDGAEGQSPQSETAASTASSASQNPRLEAETEGISLPDYGVTHIERQEDDLSTPPASPAPGADLAEDSTEPSITSDTTQSDSPLPTPTVLDDFAVQEQPSRQVDFLSHNWREEDIWASWRHIVSQRKAIYGEMSRLENASWRTWAQARNQLPMVSPATLNWLKDSDVTWLYGPLMPASSYPITSQPSSRSTQLSRSNSFAAKKPILKKRSMSEVMLQKSISSSSLIRQAATSVKLQGRDSHKLVHRPDSLYSRFSSNAPSRDQLDYFTSHSTSSASTPCDSAEKRHIRFDDRVEQCIAVDLKGPGPDFDADSDDDDDGDALRGSSDSGSDDGLLINTSVRHNLTRPASAKSSRSNSLTGRRTIETLPSTTLKDTAESAEQAAEAQHHTFGRSWSSGRLSPSPSQETLRPINPSNNYLIRQDEEDEEEIDSDSSWSFGHSNPRSSLGAAAGPSSRRDRASRKNRSSTPGPRADEYVAEGMRRTGSGMFMPYDEDEDDAVAHGLFGRVSETINTARDIAHVIWNVGWRK